MAIPKVKWSPVRGMILWNVLLNSFPRLLSQSLNLKRTHLSLFVYFLLLSLLHVFSSLPNLKNIAAWLSLPCLLFFPVFVFFFRRDSRTAQLFQILLFAGSVFFFFWSMSPQNIAASRPCCQWRAWRHYRLSRHRCVTWGGGRGRAKHPPRPARRRCRRLAPRTRHVKEGTQKRKKDENTRQAMLSRCLEWHDTQAASSTHWWWWWSLNQRQQ